MHAFNISKQAVTVWAVFQSNVIFNIRTRSQHMKHAERVFIYFIRLPAFNPDVLLHSEQAAQLHCVIRVEAAADKGCGGSDFAFRRTRIKGASGKENRTVVDESQCKGLTFGFDVDNAVRTLLDHRRCQCGFIGSASRCRTDHVQELVPIAAEKLILMPLMKSIILL